ncbi:MAG: 2,3-diaminopropionate biosynthesis protein SbnB [Myxacorys chilensis ATA2-1-KO14]|jgi:ornithine cyclodeaminase|nr:2,3-diaminopropionate biosynthesis protein SbnB [Myxacorys chilensis ATA2-1-KO14]
MSNPNSCSESSSSFTFSIITGRTVHRLVNENLEGCITIVRDAYIAHSREHSVNPSSLFLNFRDKPNARIIALPSYLEYPWHTSGIKWIASYPDNIVNGIPRASAVLILNNGETGYPFACLEASIISAARTAAFAGLAAEHLTGGRKVQTLGIIGAGFISRYIYRFLIGTGWNISNVRIYDTNIREAQRFAECVCELKQHTSISVFPTLTSVVRESDLVLFATVASEPHVHEYALFEHHPVILHVSLRDLAPELLLNTCNIVDDVHHVMNAHTSLHLAEKLAGSRDFITGSLADVLEGKCIIQRNRTVVFSPFGLGILDLALGKWIYDRAIATGEYLEIPEFFYDLER